MPITLFQNERFELNTKETLKAIDFNASKINEKYIKGEIRIVTEQARYPLPSIKTMVESEKYILHPDFQRRRRWNNEKKSKLIESFIINVPVPPIFLYEIEYAQFEVMDGLQRMTAIYEFYDDKFELQGLEQWKELNGLTYSELPEKVKEGIDRRYLSSIILLYETAKTNEEAKFMKQLVFERLNSGGIKLEPQETRNALYDGHFNKLCTKLSRNKYFCRMWGIPEPDEKEMLDSNTLSEDLIENELYRKMDDVELVLRFFAFRHLEFVEYTTLETFFDQFQITANSFSEEILIEYENLFNETIQTVYEIFGENAFNLFRIRSGRWFWYSRPTKVVYDPMMRVISQKLDKKQDLIANKETIVNEIETFYKDNYQDFEGRNNNKGDVLRRANLMDAFFNNILLK